MFRNSRLFLKSHFSQTKDVTRKESLVRNIFLNFLVPTEINVVINFDISIQRGSDHHHIS